MSKELKKWNGGGGGHKQGSVYIAAYTKKQAGELLAKFKGYADFCKLVEGRMNREIKNYFSPCWGNPMAGIEPTEPCLYWSKRYEKPTRIL